MFTLISWAVRAVRIETEFIFKWFAKHKFYNRLNSLEESMKWLNLVHLRPLDQCDLIGRQIVFQKKPKYLLTFLVILKTSFLN